MAASSVNEVQLCFWDQLDQLHCTWYGSALIIIGTIGVALNCWFVSSFLQKELQTNRAHLILLNLAIACLGHGLFGGFTFSGTSALNGRLVSHQAHLILLKLAIACLGHGLFGGFTFSGTSALNGRLVSHQAHLILLNLAIVCLGHGLFGGFTFSGTSALNGRWLFGEACCQMFGFMRTLFGCCQTSTLTLLGVERALSIRWTNTGRRLALRYYVLTIILCWMLALTLALLPLLGHGRYSCDVTGTACDYDWTSIAEPRHLAFNLCLLLLATLLPLTVACVCVCLGVISRGTLLQRRDHVEQHDLAKLSTVIPMLACLTHAPRIRVALLGKRASLIKKLPPAKL
uniref:G-protein coupled receptors family 1 profile domain-containing protein n=1 Tax=Timema tahoe TaxID=61484 RepID=A0A7R9FLI8_9NEOP|nr:unnamed protein product [Timema tahoe]